MKELQLLSKWIMKRYLVLWRNVGSAEFDFDRAFQALQKLQKPDDKRVVGLFLSELRKAGWLEVKFDPEDTRKRIYRLKPYESMFNEIISENVKEG